MIDGGLFMMLAGAAMLCIAPAARTLGQRKTVSLLVVSDQLTTAFPPTATPPGLEHLIAHAAAALDAEDRIRAARDIPVAHAEAPRSA